MNTIENNINKIENQIFYENLFFLFKLPERDLKIYKDLWTIPAKNGLNK